MEKIKQLLVEEEGQSLVEYGLIVGLVSVALVGALTAMKSKGLDPIFKTVQQKLGQAAQSAQGQ